MYWEEAGRSGHRSFPSSQQQAVPTNELNFSNTSAIIISLSFLSSLWSIYTKAEKVFCVTLKYFWGTEKDANWKKNQIK